MKITVNMFSGKPDPTWILPRERVEEFHRKTKEYDCISAFIGTIFLPLAVDGVDTVELGYRGITVTGIEAGETWEYFLPKRSNYLMELWLIETGRGQIEDYLIDVIKDRLRTKFVDIAYPDHKKALSNDRNTTLALEFSLHELDQIRNSLNGKKWTPEERELLLRVRIAELEWCYDNLDCHLHAAQQHIESLENKQVL